MADSIENISRTIDEVIPFINEFLDSFEVLFKRHHCLIEILVNTMLQLDQIESSGDPNIRLLRKEQIDRIQKLLSQLDECKFSNN